MGMIENIYETMNIRVQETAFELHLRKISPTRNILSFRETDTISGQAGLDVQKKTDGSVNIIGEVATDPVASWMIQAAQVASKFTLFTHHAKTFPNLVTALRNSMLRTGVFTDERTAEEQVVQVLNFDVHLVKDFRGRRYIERVTECIPVEDKNEYTYEHQNEKTIEGKLSKFMDNATRYFSKVTNKELYKYVNIMEYRNDEYVITNKISDYNIKEMRNNMDENDVAEFDKFIEKLGDGKRIHINGLGYFSVSIGSTESENPKKMTRGTVQITGVNFQPEKSFKKSIISRAHFVRERYKVHTVDLSPIEVDGLLSEYFKDHRSITCARMQQVCGMTRSTAYRRLQALTQGAHPSLQREGYKNATAYIPVKGHYGRSYTADRW